jgi:hypothetical protein
VLMTSFSFLQSGCDDFFGRNTWVQSITKEHQLLYGWVGGVANEAITRGAFSNKVTA